MKKQFSVTGMNCAACSAHVDKAVRSLTGVSDVSVNLLANSMTVIYDDKIVNDESIVKAVERAGYGATVYEASDRSAKDKLDAKYSHEFRSNLIKLFISIFLLLILMYFGMGHMLHLPLGFFDISTNPATNTTLQMILAAAIIGINFSFYRSGFTKLFRLAPNMDSLVAMGSAISFVYSFVRLVNIYMIYETDIALACSIAHNLYFESSAMILVFISIGKTLESRSKVKTRDSIDGLMKLKPETATRIVDGQESVVALEEVKPGDILVVRSGQQIPADGVIIKGSASIDESVLTGESIPADKTTNDNVYQATINRSGYFEMKVTRSDSDSALSEIIRIVEEASSSKAPISRLADKISAVFVPVVLGLALVVYIIWRAIGAEIYQALNYAITVIVISCPCSLGLATPTAITVGTGRAAKLGILFKSAEILENLHDVDTVVLDKTGTVTTGSLVCPPEFVLPASGISVDNLLSFAAVLEKSSVHPVGRCIYDYCVNNNADTSKSATDYKELSGSGITCKIDSKILLCGNRAFVSEYCSIDENAYNSVLENGVTPILFSYDGTYLGLISVTDSIKDDSKAAVAGLNELGTQVIMLTGDIEKTTASIAAKTGIINFESGVKPQDKESYITGLQTKGHKVAMIGDGINDAPALTSADVGIAIGTGTDIAIDSADIVLTHGSLIEAVNAIDLARRVMKNIKQNLFWAFFYNCLGIPIAAGVFTGIGITLNPMIAAALMSCSSLFVVSNALRLNLYRPKLEHEEKIEIETKKTEDKIMTFKINVEGMMCVHCKANVERALNTMPGVTATVDLESKTASVESSVEITFQDLIKTVEDAGYTVSAISRLS